MKENHSDFILFKTEDEKISVDVRFEVACRNFRLTTQHGAIEGEL
jgi:hypothetical protein